MEVQLNAFLTSALDGGEWSGEDKFKQILKKIKFQDVNWIHVAQDTIQWRILVK
jgi:hypothetical protein